MPAEGKEIVVDSDGVVDEPLRIALKIRKEDTELYFDMSESSPPCLGPMNNAMSSRQETKGRSNSSSVSRPRWSSAE